VTEPAERDRLRDFEDAWRRAVAGPTGRGGAEAARVAVERARQRRHRRASAWAMAAAAGLAALAFGVWRAPVAHTPATPVASALPTAGAAGAAPATEVVVMWLDEETALYMSLAPDAGGAGGRP
jgi:hypothetical protein